MQVRLAALGIVGTLTVYSTTDGLGGDAWQLTGVEGLRSQLVAPARTNAGTSETNLISNSTTTGVIRHDIAVSTVDAAALQKPNQHTGVPNQHITIVPEQAAARAKRLLLFVHGTNQSETSSQEILDIGPGHGYHTVAIAYPNYDAVAVTCAGSLDNDCTGKMREEILTGEDLSPLVAIPSADALEPRLLKLLQHLKDAYPNEGWGTFLRQGQVDWGLISVAGHSQGAGHVALMAKRHPFARVAIISGVADVTATGQPAAWLYRPNVTPVDRIWGFTHVADYVVPLVLAQASWKVIGIDRFGPAQSTDSGLPPYLGSHMLTTALLPASGINPHLAMIDDDKLPRNADGTIPYRAVWEYMLFP